MKHIIPGLETRAKDGVFCLFSAIEDTLRYQKYDLSCVDIFMLCNGFNVEYQSDLNYVGYSGLDNVIENIAKENLFKVNMCYKLQDKDELFQKACNAVLDNHVVILFVGTENLNYSDAFREISDENRGHCILMYGIDSEEGMVYVADSYFKDSSGRMKEYQGPASIEDIRKSIFGFVWFDTDKASKLINKKMVLDITINNLRTFLEGVTTENKFFGNLAFKKYAFDLYKLENLDEDSFAKACIDINFNIKVRSAIVIIDNMISFIRNNEDFQIEGYDTILEELQILRREWEKVALNATKAGLTKRKRMIPAICEMANNTIQIQDKTFGSYLQYLEKIKIM
ncbi:hypothetical protein EHE19_014915 [Ruminiclostridium herbifermentans]|uniref:Butirosin biosynthesis protein H N-terminal domain-containing protein n=1 Tax=Ruminiclostridium herbifermentans TaxID=2488810 RepID=A0A4U7JLM7_9FIRM|nr:BtrH N-terminal domain-containing protein [Ruminiclostridium herbifermentans]QNU66157.1 hypothetical protein EHE19_014915 [Ruminiclostridium herbifermentans]